VKSFGFEGGGHGIFPIAILMRPKAKAHFLGEHDLHPFLELEDWEQIIILFWGEDLLIRN